MIQIRLISKQDLLLLQERESERWFTKISLKVFIFVIMIGFDKPESNHWRHSCPERVLFLLLHTQIGLFTGLFCCCIRHLIRWLYLFVCCRPWHHFRNFMTQRTQKIPSFSLSIILWHRIVTRGVNAKGFYMILYLIAHRTLSHSPPVAKCSFSSFI